MTRSMRVLLLALAISSVWPASAFAAITDNLLGYWTFDGTPADQSGNGRDLTLAGGVGFAAGLFGQALDLHNNDAQFAYRSDTAFDFGSGDFTVQVWLNLNSYGLGSFVPIEKFDPVASTGWTLTLLNNCCNFEFFFGPSNAFGSGLVGVSLNQWHQVVIRRSGASGQILFDGGVIATGAISTILPTTAPLLIGRRHANDPSGLTYPVDGRIDEVAIWGRSLSDTEIAQLYNSGSGMQLPISVPVMTWNEFGALFRRETDPDQCSPTGRTVVSVTHKVVNDEDSGVAGNFWAMDSYSRLLTIVEVHAPTSPGGAGKYCTVTQYFGNFVTRAGASPNATCLVTAGVKGQYRGGYRTQVFDGTLNPSPSQKITGNLGIFDYQCDGAGHCPGVFNWRTTYFLGPLTGDDLDWWGWMYYGFANGSWINSSDGNSGDICSP